MRIVSIKLTMLMILMMIMQGMVESNRGTAPASRNSHQEEIEKQKKEAEQAEQARERARREEEAKTRAQKEAQARKRAEEERIAREKAAKEKAEKERQAKAEREKQAREKAQKEREAKAEREKEAREKAQKEREAKAERERQARQKAQKQKEAKIKAEKEKEAKQKAQRQRLAKAQKQKQAKQKAAKQKQAKQQAARDEAARQRAQKAKQAIKQAVQHQQHQTSKQKQPKDKPIQQPQNNHMLLIRRQSSQKKTQTTQKIQSVMQPDKKQPFQAVGQEHMQMHKNTVEVTKNSAKMVMKAVTGHGENQQNRSFQGQGHSKTIVRQKLENHGKNKLPKETNQGESTSSDTSVKPADAPVVNDASSGVVSQGSEGKKSKKKKVLAETNENIQGNTDGGKQQQDKKEQQEKKKQEEQKKKQESEKKKEEAERKKQQAQKKKQEQAERKKEEIEKKKEEMERKKEEADKKKQEAEKKKHEQAEKKQEQKKKEAEVNENSGQKSKKKVKKPKEAAMTNQDLGNVETEANVDTKPIQNVNIGTVDDQGEVASSGKNKKSRQNKQRSDRTNSKSPSIQIEIPTNSEHGQQNSMAATLLSSETKAIQPTTASVDAASQQQSKQKQKKHKSDQQNHQSEATQPEAPEVQAPQAQTPQTDATQPQSPQPQPPALVIQHQSTQSPAPQPPSSTNQAPHEPDAILYDFQPQQSTHQLGASHDTQTPLITHDIGIPQAAIDATISDQQHIDPIAPDSPLSGEVKVEENKDKDKDKKKKKHGEGKHNGNGIDGGQNAQITTDNTGAAVGTNSVPTTTSQPNCDVNVGTNGQPAGVDASNVVPVVTPTDNNVTPVPVVTPNPVVVDPTAGQQPTTTTTTTTESIPVRTVPTVPTTPITPESQQSQQAPSATLSVSIDNSQAATIQNKIIKAGKRNKLHGDHDSKGKYSSTDMTSHRGNKVETGQKNSQTVPVNDNGAVIISTPTQNIPSVSTPTQNKPSSDTSVSQVVSVPTDTSKPTDNTVNNVNVPTDVPIVAPTPAPVADPTTQSSSAPVVDSPPQPTQPVPTIQPQQSSPSSPTTQSEQSRPAKFDFRSKSQSGQIRHNVVVKTKQPTVQQLLADQWKSFLREYLQCLGTKDQRPQQIVIKGNCLGKADKKLKQWGIKIIKNQKMYKDQQTLYEGYQRRTVQLLKNSQSGQQNKANQKKDAIATDAMAAQMSSEGNSPRTESNAVINQILNKIEKMPVTSSQRMSKLTMIAKKLEDVLKQLPEKFAQLDKLANDSGKIKEKSELIYNKFLVAHNMERAKE